MFNFIPNNCFYKSPIKLLLISIFIMFLLGILFLSKAYCEENIYGDIIVKINRVYDGDTIYVDVPNIPDAFGKDIGVRIRGIDTPEIKGSCDKEKQLALTAKDVVVKLLEKEKFITLKNISRDMYFRLDSDIILQDGTSISIILLKAGLAYPYDGKTPKKSWCD